MTRKLFKLFDDFAMPTMKCVLHSVLFVVVIAACGATARNGATGDGPVANCGPVAQSGGAPATSPAEGCEAGAAAGGEAPVKPSAGCDSANATPLDGRPYDAQLDCIDTTISVPGVGCSLSPGPDDPQDSDGHQCLRRRSDGAEFYAFAFYKLGFDSELWERCPDAQSPLPKACYAAGCPEAPRSSCTLEQTKAHYDCSATGEYDENCCGRPSCKVAADCADDEDCARIDNSSGQWECWLTSNQGCDCGGPLGGPAKMRCLKK